MKESVMLMDENQNLTEFLKETIMVYRIVRYFFVTSIAFSTKQFYVLLKMYKRNLRF